MQRLIYSGFIAATVAIAATVDHSLALAGVTTAQTAQMSATTDPVMAQKQLVSGTDCQSAAIAIAKPDFPSKSAEYRDDVLITTRYCSATAHNQLTPADPQIVVVSADPNASGDDKIFFKTIQKNDAKKVHDACVAAGQATLAYLQATAATAPQADTVIAGGDVLTSTGRLDCDGFLRATAADNPLIVLAPSVISGSAISVHILNLIGLKRPATEVEVAVAALGHRVSGVVASSADEIRERPQIILQPLGRNPQ